MDMFGQVVPVVIIMHLVIFVLVPRSLWAWLPGEIIYSQISPPELSYTIRTIAEGWFLFP